MAEQGHESVDDLSDDERAALESGDSTAVRIAVARRYYLEDASKVAIADAFGFSRFQVARMLRDARRSGLVRIEIGAPGRPDRELSAALQDRLGLAKAVVVTSATSPHATVEHVGHALAEELTGTVQEGDVVGVTWSGATVVMSQSLRQLRRCTVVQLAGAIYPPAGVPGSVEVSRRVAQVAGGDAHAIYAPLVVADAATAAGLRAQPEIAEVLARGRSLDVAVVSVGAWSSSASAVYDLLDAGTQRELAEEGACGEVSGRVFDLGGRPVTGTLDGRVIGIEADELRAVPTVLASSSGAFRAEATFAAIQAGLVHTLVCDTELATALLEVQQGTQNR